MPSDTSDKNLRKLVFNKTNGKCAYCGCKLDFDYFHVDHIKPKLRVKYPEYETRESGKSCIENYFPSCASCNSSKSTYDLEDFRLHVLDRMNMLRKTSSYYRITLRFGLIQELNTDVVFYFEKINIPIPNGQ